MDTPPIQYARTEDGVNIAYYAKGEGPAVVVMPFLFQLGVEHDQGADALAPWFEGITRGRQLVRYDARGMGLSDRPAADLSHAAMLRDLDAVVTAMKLDRFAIWAHGFAGPIAVQFAHQYPDRVERMVLWESCISAKTLMETTAFALALRLLNGPALPGDWDAFTETLAHLQAGWQNAELARLTAAMMRSTVDQQTFLAFVDAAWDASAVVDSLRTPTLVGHERGAARHVISLAQDLATRIPDARLVVVAEGPGGAPSDEQIAVTDAFLQASDPAAEMSPPTAAVQTILFTDLESSTALTQAIGDDRAQEVLRGHDDAVRAALTAHDGEEVKHTGDGIMAAFGSAVGAVEAALQIQRELAGAEVRVRVGLNAGEPIAEDDDYFGAAVQLAARVCDRAEPGQVLVSNVVKELCTGKLFQFDDQGEATLKGFPEPVRLFVVGEGD